MRNCKIESCSRKHKSKGFCGTHLYRFLKHGDAHKVLDNRRKRKYATIHERFLNSFCVANNNCWLWGQAFRSSGYGCMTWEKKVIDAHRYSYSYYKGEIPKGLFVCHRCDNKMCVNPDHLFVGTPKDNVLDMVNKKRQRVGEKTNLNKLSELQVIDIKNCLSMGVRQIELVKKYNVSRTCICDIKTGKRWAYLK